jgi:hypothetical protein
MNDLSTLLSSEVLLKRVYLSALAKEDLERLHLYPAESLVKPFKLYNFGDDDHQRMCFLY